MLSENLRTVYIPFCDGPDLKVFPLTSWNQLEKKSFGILEPKDEFIKELPESRDFSIDLAILPGVAFDLKLNRMGYGRAYFDKLLSDEMSKAYRIALAYGDQIFETIPFDQYDVPMHEIVTNRGIVSATEKISLT